MLRRLGNKKKLLPVLLAHFPEKIHLFIDLFCGTASVTRAMVGRAPYIIANDIDADVFNLYQMVRHRKEELIAAMRHMPIHDALFQHWRKNTETDPIFQAVRFLFMSNFGFMGCSNSMKCGTENSKETLLTEIDTFFEQTQHVQWLQADFRQALRQFSIRDANTSFIYCDPPYLDTDNNYQQGFSEQDTLDLFDILMASGIRFAVSEFDHPLVMELAKTHGLIVNDLGMRRNIGNRRTELLITNYCPVTQTRLF